MTRKPRLRILHLFSGLTAEGDEARAVQLINAFGPACEHGIVSGSGDTLGGIDRGICATVADDFPRLQGRVTPGRLQRMARAMVGHDLVLTYGYGAMAAALAQTMLGGTMPLPPLVHHEDADEPEASSLRNWYRRIALGRASALVVPSRRLAAIAVKRWHQPQGRVQRIAPGIRTAAYAAKPRRDALPRVIKREGELWLGTMDHAASPQDLTGLVRAFAALPDPWHLVILGDGPHQGAVRDEALRLGLAHRVHLPGKVAEPAKVLGLFDLFALLPGSGEFPIGAVAAMAAGLAIAASDGADIKELLAPENRPFVVDAHNQNGFADMLRTLAETPGLRASVGAANRALARAEYDQAAMIAAYRAVYGAALGRNGFP
ncbi:MAG: glycosyltransferase [Pseudomonadota bacterium]|nr:glycosyltransferase [Pseudomonadota bacterium]